MAGPTRLEFATFCLTVYTTDWERMSWRECKLYGENSLAGNPEPSHGKRLAPVGGVCTG